MESQPEPELYEISAVARQLGVSADTIRQWERRNLIAPPRRTASGKRLFTPIDVEAMEKAQQARRARTRSLPAAA